MKNRIQSRTTDVYSLGIILVQILTGRPTRDGRVPDEVYQMSPVLGRTLEDFLDEDQQKRLLLISDNGPFRYAWLDAFLRETFELVDDEPAVGGSAWARWYARLAPGSYEPRSLFRKWRQLPRQSHHGYLLLFLLIAAATWWGIAARTAIVELDDVLVLQPDPLPSGMLLAANVIAFNQGLIAWKFYSSVLARLTVAPVPGAMARATEVSMRGMAVVALPTAVLAAAWKPELWAWTCAFGARAVTLTNLLTFIVAKRLVEVGGRNFSTVPPAHADFPAGSRSGGGRCSCMPW